MSQDLYSRLGLSRKWPLKPSEAAFSNTPQDTALSSQWSAADVSHSQSQSDLSSFGDDSQQSLGDQGGQQAPQSAPRQISFAQVKVRGPRAVDLQSEHSQVNVTTKLEGLESLLQTISTSLSAFSSRLAVVEDFIKKELVEQKETHTEVLASLRAQAKADKSLDNLLRRLLQECRQEQVRDCDRLLTTLARDKEYVCNHINLIVDRFRDVRSVHKSQYAVPSPSVHELHFPAGTPSEYRKRKLPTPPASASSSAKKRATQVRLQCLLQIEVIAPIP